MSLLGIYLAAKCKCIPCGSVIRLLAASIYLVSASQRHPQLSQGYFAPSPTPVQGNVHCCTQVYTCQSRCAGLKAQTSDTSLLIRLDLLGTKLAQTLCALDAKDWSDPNTVTSLNNWIASGQGTDANIWDPLMVAPREQQAALDKIANEIAGGQVGALNLRQVTRNREPTSFGRPRSRLVVSCSLRAASCMLSQQRS